MLNSVKHLVKRVIHSLKHPGSVIHPNTWCSEAYVSFLKSNGVVIGSNTRFINPDACRVDFHRGDYITIGDNCCFSEATILAHDYSWYTLLESCNDVLPDPGGKVIIGNNCFVGFHAIILKDTNIGDNCIIAAGAVVKGNVPANTVWGGCPAKQICTIDDFYKKKKENKIKDAIIRRDHIKKTKHRNPYIEEMGLFSLLFIERTKDNYDSYIKNQEFNGVKDSPILRNYYFSSTPEFPSFEEFLSVKL